MMPTMMPYRHTDWRRVLKKQYHENIWAKLWAILSLMEQQSQPSLKSQIPLDIIVNITYKSVNNIPRSVLILFNFVLILSAPCKIFFQVESCVRNVPVLLLLDSFSFSLPSSAALALPWHKCKVFRQLQWPGCCHDGSPPSVRLGN